MNILQIVYKDGICPSCAKEIPHHFVEGNSCWGCGYIFWYIRPFGETVNPFVHTDVTPSREVTEELLYALEEAAFAKTEPSYLKRLKKSGYTDGLSQYISEEVEKGWPGDGSGLDDLADFNANEVEDYRDE